MKTISLINRRFIRTKALQNLYAYHINKQAYLQLALDNICNDFKPDIFSKIVIDKKILTQQKKQAITLFNEIINQKEKKAILCQDANPVEASVKKEILSFTQNMYLQKILLQTAFDQGKKQIQNDCLYALQLLIQWDYLSNNTDSSSLIPTNKLLQRLQHNASFTKLVRMEKISWEQHTELITSWHTTYFKYLSFSEQYCPEKTTVMEDQAFLEHSVKNIIFKHKVIQDFFSNLDQSWEEHKLIARKLLLHTLKLLSKEVPPQALVFDMFTTHWGEQKQFYHNLIEKFLLEEGKYEALITKKGKNWDIERMVLIDRLIIKLALAEIIHCDEIPTKVSINEYIEIAKRYGTPKSGQFINGVLDAIIATLHEQGEIHLKQ